MTSQTGRDRIEAAEGAPIDFITSRDFMYRCLYCVAAAAAVLALESSALAQQMGGGGGGGGFGGGGGGFGAGGNLGNNLQTSFQTSTTPPQNLPLILGRNTQGVFGSRTLGSGQRQRYRGFMGSSQAGGGPGQYSNSGAFRNARRGSLPGSGLSTFSTISGSQRANAGQAGQMQPNQQTARRPNAKKPTKRTTVRVGFTAAGPNAGRVMADLDRRLSRMLGVTAASALLEGRTVVLRGSVATLHDRDLAEQLALLEPGVDLVRNELTTSDSRPSEVPVDRLPASPPSETPDSTLEDARQSPD